MNKVIPCVLISIAVAFGTVPSGVATASETKVERLEFRTVKGKEIAEVQVMIYLGAQRIPDPVRARRSARELDDVTIFAAFPRISEDSEYYAERSNMHEPDIRQVYGGCREPEVAQGRCMISIYRKQGDKMVPVFGYPSRSVALLQEPGKSHRSLLVNGPDADGDNRQFEDPKLWTWFVWEWDGEQYVPKKGVSAATIERYKKAAGW